MTQADLRLGEDRGWKEENTGTKGLERGFRANSFWEGSDSIFFRLCRPRGKIKDIMWVLASKKEHKSSKLFIHEFEMLLLFILSCI